jgi:hypothetical protein
MTRRVKPPVQADTLRKIARFLRMTLPLSVIPDTLDQAADDLEYYRSAVERLAREVDYIQHKLEGRSHETR